MAAAGTPSIAPSARSDAQRLAALSQVAVLAREGSFTAAATALGVSPSALSQTLRTLEADLGVRLFNRTTRRVALTEIGEQLLGRATPALDTLSEALATAREQQGQPGGTLRINLSRVAFSALLEPHVGGFLARYPAVQLELVFDESLADLVGGRYDAGIRLAERLQQDMIAVPLGPEERLVTVGAPAYFAQQGRPTTPAELAAHRCLASRLSRGDCYRWEYTVEGQDIALDLPGVFVSNDVAALLAACEQGAGLAHVLYSTAAPYLARGRLEAVLQAFCPPFPGFYLYTTSRRLMPPKLRVFIDYLKQQLGSTMALPPPARIPA